MTEISHGGKRQGAGRPKGSVKINSELQRAFREHSQTAIDAIVAIAEEPEHPQQLKACEIILQRGYGAPTASNEAEEIVNDFLSGKISAIKAGLLMESKSLKIGPMLNSYISQELQVLKDKRPFLAKAEPLPLP